MHRPLEPNRRSDARRRLAQRLMSPRAWRVGPLAGERLLVCAYAVLALLWLLVSWAINAALQAALPCRACVDAGLDIAFVAISAATVYLLLRRMRHTRREQEAARSREIAALRQQAHSAQLLQTLADNSPDAIFAKDRDGRYLLFNRAAAQAVGAAPDGVLGRDDQALFPAEIAAAIRERDRDVMQQDQPQTFEETLDTPMGVRTFLTTKGPLRDAQGVIGLFGIARDITEMVQARQQLTASEQRLRLAAAASHVWDWDVTGQRIVSPSSFWRQLGHEPPADADAWQRLQALMHPDDCELWQATLHAHIVDHQPYALEFRARHRNGHWCWFRTQGQAVWDAQGRATYMAGTTFNVSDQHHAEDALLRTQSELSQLSRRLMEQERETTARLAQSLHDNLGQVLSGARLHLDLAQGDAASAQTDSQQRLGRVSTLLDAAIAEVRRMLIDLRPPLLDEQGLAAALDNEICRGTASGLGVLVHLETDAAAAKARWPDAVEHAAFMIAREGLANALQHAQASAVRVSLNGDGHRLDLRVEDDGQGITDIDRPGHLGLVGMRERAASIGAVLSIERLGGPGQHGTTLRLAWPCSAV